MPVQFLHDGATTDVRSGGTRHRFDIEDRDVADLDGYSYSGPDDQAPDDVLEKLEAHVQEHLVVKIRDEDEA